MIETALDAVLDVKPVETFKLDLGCGKNKRDGFFGLDSIGFDAVDAKCDLGAAPWVLSTVFRPDKLPFLLVDGALPDECVDEAQCSHFLEHLTWPQRINFINELYRVMKPGAKCLLIIPHWASARYYGDPTHQAPISEWAFFYWDKAWRESQAPHCGYTCDFNVTYGYNLHPEIAAKSNDHQLYALKFYKDAAQDVVATMEKRPRT